MSTYDMILEKGIEKGAVKAIIRGYENGVTIKLLAIQTDFTEDKVKEILIKNGFSVESSK